MAEPKPPRALAIALAVIVVAAGIGGFAFLYYENHRSPGAQLLRVGVGDNATVNYIGIFGSSPQIGRVFDTSLYSVATNNVTWPKSLEYHSRGGYPSNYTPLAVYVGANAPSSGYVIGNLTFSTVVTGFWQGLIGLAGNQTRYITVPPALGYDFVNQSCFVTLPFVSTVPVLVAQSPSDFTKQFPNVTATAGNQFANPSYGWTDLILTVNSTAVVYENLPTLGYATTAAGIPVRVTAISSTTITLTAQLGPSQAGLVAGTSTASVCGSTTYIVSSVNLGTDTYVADYNPEVYGQTLIFAVTVVDIFPGT